jgi:hypothetical protein
MERRYLISSVLRHEGCRIERMGDITAEESRVFPDDHGAITSLWKRSSLFNPILGDWTITGDCGLYLGKKVIPGLGSSTFPAGLYAGPSCVC